MEDRKDYYKILELTEEDKKLPKEEFLAKVSKNFKKLAIKYHPDRNKGNKEAEEKFKEVNEANQVLSDYDGKKAEYDNPMSQFSFNGGMDMEDIINHFRNMGFGEDFNPFGGHQQMRQKGTNIQGSVEVTLEEVLHGTEKTVRYTRQKVCHTCHGSGKDGKSEEAVCPHCHGTGFISERHGYMVMRSTCPYCHGVGKYIKNPCSTCGGSGLEAEKVTKTIKIPAGVMNGMAFNLEGWGNEVPGNGNIPGDLHIVIREAEDNRFVRDGNRLFMRVNVGVLDAIIGTKKRIRTLSGKKIDLTIPPGSEEVRRLVVNGYGLPDMNTGVMGDLICVVHLVMPVTVDSEERKKIEKLAKSSHFKVND